MTNEEMMAERFRMALYEAGRPDLAARVEIEERDLDGVAWSTVVVRYPAGARIPDEDRRVIEKASGLVAPQTGVFHFPEKGRARLLREPLR